MTEDTRNWLIEITRDKLCRLKARETKSANTRTRNANRWEIQQAEKALDELQSGAPTG